MLYMFPTICVLPNKHAEFLCVAPLYFDFTAFTVAIIRYDGLYPGIHSLALVVTFVRSEESSLQNTGKWLLNTLGERFPGSVAQVQNMSEYVVNMVSWAARRSGFLSQKPGRGRR